MCVTNDKIINMLKDIRAYESGEIKNSEKQAELLAHIKVVMDEFDTISTLLKKDLIDTLEGQIMYIPDVMKKVYLLETGSSISIDIENVYDELKKLGIEKEITNITTIVKHKVDNHDNFELQSIVKHNSKRIPGNTNVTIRKMNKKELIEHTE